MKTLYTLLILFCFLCGSAQNDPDEAVGSTGTVECTYLGTTTTYTTVRAADGNIWLQQNLGSAQVANASNDVSAYGHYFQWGRWDDDHQLPTGPTAPATALSPNNPSGIDAEPNPFYLGNDPNEWWHGGAQTDTWSGDEATSTNGVDPCTCLGTGWYLPSQAEWSALLSAEGINTVTSGFDSNLKLVAAGSREAQLGSLINAGTYGSYWTSTPSGMYAKDITILTDAINDNDDAYRSYGMSVRCMNTTCTGLVQPSTIFGPDTVCAGGTYTYSVPLTSNVETYDWAVGGGWEDVLFDANEITVTYGMETVPTDVTIRLINECTSTDFTIMPILILHLPEPVIYADGASLETGSYESYQWYFGNDPIDGATEPSFTPLEGGDYSVMVTDADGCNGISPPFTFIIDQLTGQVTSEAVRIYPNPAGDYLMVEFSLVPVANAQLYIYDANGRVVISSKWQNQRTNTPLDISGLEGGLYMLRIISEEEVLTKTFTKN